VYQATSASGDTSQMTVNDYLNAQDIRYLYLDANGQPGPEQTLIADDNRYDFAPAVSFNGSGRGVAAWVHTANSVPVSDSGIFARQDTDIQAAVWDPLTHTFLTPITLPGAGVADYQPAVFAAEDNKLCVVWLRDTPG